MLSLAPFFFYKFRDRVVRIYDTLFGHSGEGGYSATTNFSRKWGWYSSLYSLSQGDVTRVENITKLNVHNCLTMLSFEKEKNEIEAKQIKSKFK